MADEPTTWEEAVTKAGSVEKARVDFPELDPAYKALVKEHGQDKGSQMYAQKYIDPATEQSPGDALRHSIASNADRVSGDISNWANDAGNDLETAIKGTISGKGLLPDLHGGPSGSDGGKGKDKGKDTGTPPGPTQAQIEQEIANNPFNKLGEGLVKQLQEEQAPIEKAISGQDTAASVKSATAQAFADAGVSANSSAGEWLNSNIAKANAADQPMQAAMAAYGKAYEAGQKGVDTALLNQGQANAIGQTTAAEQPYLNLITQHLGSGQYYSLTPEQAGSLPQALQYYLQQAGTQGITTPKGGWPAAFTQGASGPSGAPGPTASFGAQVTGAANQPTTTIAQDTGTAP